MINSIVVVSREHQRERMRKAQSEKQLNVVEQGKKKKLRFRKIIQRLYNPRKQLSWEMKFESG